MSESDKTEEIKAEIERISGYPLSVFRKRVDSNIYDALMVLEEVKHMAKIHFFNKNLGITAYDFSRRARNKVGIDKRQDLKVSGKDKNTDL